MKRLILLWYILFCECVPIRQPLIKLSLHNYGGEEFEFVRCNTTNKILNKIDPYLDVDQKFYIKSFSIGSGSCTYQYNNQLLDFQWYVDLYHFRYGITNHDDLYTNIKIINKYKAKFIII